MKLMNTMSALPYISAVTLLLFASTFVGHIEQAMSYGPTLIGPV